MTRSGSSWRGNAAIRTLGRPPSGAALQISEWTPLTPSPRGENKVVRTLGGDPVSEYIGASSASLRMIMHGNLNNICAPQRERSSHYRHS